MSASETKVAFVGKRVVVFGDSVDMAGKMIGYSLVGNNRFEQVKPWKIAAYFAVYDTLTPLVCDLILVLLILNFVPVEVVGLFAPVV